MIENMEKIIASARNLLCYGTSEPDTMRKLVAKGITPELAFLAIKAAAIANNPD
jgi:hypothetical protein